MKNERKTFAFVVVFVSFVFAACQTAPTNPDQTADLTSPDANSPNVSPSVSPTNSRANANSNNVGQTGAHEHIAPHGGTLVAFGDEFAHLELVLDSSNGQLTAYALDGEAEKAVLIAQDEIEMAVEKPKKFSIKLAAQENALTGERRGATSEFRGQADQLKDLKEFDARIVSLTIRGQRFDGTHFNFPKGNESSHKH